MPNTTKGAIRREPDKCITCWSSPIEHELALLNSRGETKGLRKERGWGKERRSIQTNDPTRSDVLNLYRSLYKQTSNFPEVPAPVQNGT